MGETLTPTNNQSAHELEVWLTGGAWITAAGHGRLSHGRPVPLAPGRVSLPPHQEIFDRRLPRYGRYDDYTKLGCSCVALALKDAGLAGAGERRPIGIVSSSAFECLETDAAYYRTAVEEGGTLASPNVFSYTVPGVVLGECAVIFGLTGPTLCVGEQGGRGQAALLTALRLVAGGMADKMLAGWIDSAPPEATSAPEPVFSGAVFVLLESKPLCANACARRMMFAKGKLTDDGGRAIEALPELFEF